MRGSRAIGTEQNLSATLTPKGVVFIVDDDVSVRVALEELLRDAGWNVEGFASAQGFLSHPRAKVPSCLVLDISLPDLNGLELQKHVAAERAEMPIIFITGYSDVPTTVRAMKAGAIEFLTKPFSDDAILMAIRSAIQRSRDMLAQERALGLLRNRYASLSRREREVMGLIVAGLLNKQVGGTLGISEITVKAHRGQVMRKMEASSFADLINQALELGLRRLSYATSAAKQGTRSTDNGSVQRADEVGRIAATQAQNASTATRHRLHQPSQGEFRAIHSEDIKWKPFAAFPPAARIAVLIGDPSKPGPYVIRVKLPDGTKMMPHKHPEDRIYTVLSGVFYIGLGDVFDETGLVAYGPGSVVVLPGGQAHFHWAKSGEYITQVTAIGPLGLKYVRSEDDPRRRH